MSAASKYAVITGRAPGCAQRFAFLHVFLKFDLGQLPSRRRFMANGASTPLHSYHNAADFVSFRDDGYRLSVTCCVHGRAG